MTYNFKAIETKWQKKWEEKKIFHVKEGKKKKYYVLEMFPYPSSSGLHMGHALNYTIGDVYARFKRMQGFNVLYPMGFDALGLPAENAAIKAKSHPKKFTEIAIKNYIRQMKELGLSYDWDKSVSTMEPEYYKWNQFFFLKFLNKGLIYRKKAPVNWCSKCETVLANEQVHNGKCWRHEDTDVETKNLEQWFIRTTKYADELLEDVKTLQWPERIKIMQKNWIGKSYGTEIQFEINGKTWPIFTTRPDTIYGVTFMVVSAKHPNLMDLVIEEQEKDVKKFLKKIETVSEKELETLEKQGVFTGSYAINSLNNEKVPIYVGNFVLADYGSGMVMAVPAHDQRDFEFAKKYHLSIKEVIKGGDIKERAYEGEGELVNSGKFDRMNSKKAREEITKELEKKKLGKKQIQYRLKDWLVSRQRYWGTPIPIIYCNKCGVVPVPEKNLPVILPEKVKFGKGNPLETSRSFISVKCPKCKGKAKRETDTMDTFFDSSWYYLRYCDNKNKKKPFDITKVRYWMPVDQYIGGAEHACMHLIYARFFTKALRDLGFVAFDEPFTRLFNQGMLRGMDGNKMSKSKGNVINPDEVSRNYGMDTARFFLLSLAAPDKDRDWSKEGIESIQKFMIRVINYFKNVKIGKADAKIESKLNKAIKQVTEDIENFRYNLAVIKIRELFNFLPDKTSKDVLEKNLKLLHPFCPHITEELWSKLGNKEFISLEKWPVSDEKKINEKLEKQEQAVEKLAEDINNIKNLIGGKKAKAFIYVLPNELRNYGENLGLIKKKTGLDIEIYSVADKNKRDPENKSKKVKPERPGIYLE
ncbi:leucine--tRNA ligase subunit alpha [archaeon BMS3Abin17]|nr:leucine--tRNA ligase subunit alpha [archaeon BMS3Abin17]HDZ60612.1 leucine--tRNA ligase [Candidatus Pacearchaeota archaeon]